MKTKLGRECVECMKCSVCIRFKDKISDLPLTSAQHLLQIREILAAWRSRTMLIQHALMSNVTTEESFWRFFEQLHVCMHIVHPFAMCKSSFFHVVLYS